MLIHVFYKALHYTTSSDSGSQSTPSPPNLSNIHFYIILSPTLGFLNWLFPSYFQNEFYHLLRTATHPAYLILLYLITDLIGLREEYKLLSSPHKFLKSSVISSFSDANIPYRNLSSSILYSSRNPSQNNGNYMPQLVQHFKFATALYDDQNKPRFFPYGSWASTSL
jgi:hypothetical protein